uniref:Uncharacterized protein n=1 Tax=Papilio xuthus TaxID=66420 RepID=I4DLS0_PAPXU|nr:unknown unsecreted protein [Papilio xuthus]
MNSIKQWLKHSSLLSKMLMGVSITTAVYITNKLWYTPYTRRRKLKEAEEWANFIIEQDERLQENNENQ